MNLKNALLLLGLIFLVNSRPALSLLPCCDLDPPITGAPTANPTCAAACGDVGKTLCNGGYGTCCYSDSCGGAPEFSAWGWYAVLALALGGATFYLRQSKRKIKS